MCLMYVDLQPYGCSHNPRLVITHPADTNYADTLVSTAQQPKCSCVAYSPIKGNHEYLGSPTPLYHATVCLQQHLGLTQQRNVLTFLQGRLAHGPWLMAHACMVCRGAVSCQQPGLAWACACVWMQHRLLTCTL